MDNLKDKPIPMDILNLSNLRYYSNKYLNLGLISQVEFNEFRKIFTDQNINLENY